MLTDESGKCLGFRGSQDQSVVGFEQFRRTNPVAVTVQDGIAGAVEKNQAAGAVYRGVDR